MPSTTTSGASAAAACRRGGGGRADLDRAVSDRAEEQQRAATDAVARSKRARRPDRTLPSARARPLEPCRIARATHGKENAALSRAPLRRPRRRGGDAVSDVASASSSAGEGDAGVGARRRRCGSAAAPLRAAPSPMPGRTTSSSLMTRVFDWSRASVLRPAFIACWTRRSWRTALRRSAWVTRTVAAAASNSTAAAPPPSGARGLRRRRCSASTTRA